MFSNSWDGRWRGRTPVGDGHRRARAIVSPSGGIVRGKFPSRKNGRMVHHEGLLELDAIYVFETSPRVVRYREQPATICYPDGFRTRRYTPDFELLLVTGETVLVEVKPTQFLSNRVVADKLACVAAHLRRSIEPLVILTEHGLRDEPRQSSLRWLYHRALRVPPTEDAMRTALHRLGSVFPTSIEAADLALSKSGVDSPSLLFSGLLHCSLQAPVSITTQLVITQESDDGWFRIAPEHGF